MKKAIEGKYYIKYDSEKRCKFEEKIEVVCQLLDAEQTEYSIFFGIHKKLGEAISVTLFVKSTNTSLAEEQLQHSKDIVEKKLGELNLIIELYIDLIPILD